MRSTTVFVSALSFAVSAMAQTEGFAAMSAPSEGESVPAGKTYTIVWEAGKATGPIDIVIMAGPTPAKLQLGDKIASNVDVTAGSFEWKVDCSLGDQETYGLDIISVAEPGTFQYSFPFHIDNSGCGSSGSSSSSAASDSSATASASTYPTSDISSSASAKPSETVSEKPSTASATSASVTVTSSVSVPESSSAAGTASASASVTSAVPSPSVTSAPTGSTTLVATTSSTSQGSSTASTTPIPTGAAPKNAAGSLALVGGLAAAIFAL